MARIKGVDIPDNKRIEIALTYIYGIGRNLSNQILKDANVDINKRAKDKKWTIKFANGERVIKLLDTKKEAIAYAEALARNQDGVVLVHASKGKQKGKIQKK